jgi:hypothetical protein
MALCRADIQAEVGGHRFDVRAEARDARAALDIAAARLHRQVEAAHAGQESALRRRGTRPARPGRSGSCRS